MKLEKVMWNLLVPACIAIYRQRISIGKDAKCYSYKLTAIMYLRGIAL